MLSQQPKAALAGLVALAAFTLWITWRAKLIEITMQGRGAETHLVNKPAPDFSLAALDGHAVSPADFRGKQKLVITFWASWCGPCKLELPALRTFYQQNRQVAGNQFEILAISIDAERSEAESYANTEKLPFPILLDPLHRAADAYTVDSIPTLFVIDKSGKVVYGHVGFDMIVQETLKRQLEVGNSVTVRGALH
jgi:peroxiredoxin